MHEIIPDDYKECPLGLGCSEFNEQNEYGLQLWQKCPNSNYCKGVCEAWYIPLKIDDDRTVVNLYLPYNYDEKIFAKEMKKYGWVEAERLPLHRGEHFDFYTINDELLVIENKFKYGFAIAVDIRRKKYIQKCVIDKHGLWWCTNGRPPKI